MLLCLDTGNSNIHGGVFAGDELRAQFRKSTHPAGSADELGVFFNAVLRANGVEPAEIDTVAICSVVPAALHALRAAAVKYFRCEPFVLQAGVKTGLRVRYRNPHEVGADRIASAIAAVHLHPRRNLIVVDFGTATTIEAITAEADYLGGAILPGVGISAETLANHTAKLPRVEIMRPPMALGRTTAESIQSGLFHGHAGAVARLVQEISGENFGGERPHVLGTGGFARMFEGEGLFDELVPELVLTGLREAVRLNREPA
ncbi:type III pantothenate kinase [Horticoccus luteus]|uniref:Type III pantothenate kinase n=1 Tax=Horticoccus luteus TaxID=2862869 RepID=A0A8F9TSR8_9BACT|nr:type III pantothenate kinase [Horticoccus luteus]QYM78375.1 type III pantothenate kinase [Horticoccus luteus]